MPRLASGIPQQRSVLTVVGKAATAAQRVALCRSDTVRLPPSSSSIKVRAAQPASTALRPLCQRLFLCAYSTL